MFSLALNTEGSVATSRQSWAVEKILRLSRLEGTGKNTSCGSIVQLKDTIIISSQRRGESLFENCQINLKCWCFWMKRTGVSCHNGFKRGSKLCQGILKLGLCEVPPTHKLIIILSKWQIKGASKSTNLFCLSRL